MVEAPMPMPCPAQPAPELGVKVGHLLEVFQLFLEIISSAQADPAPPCPVLLPQLVARDVDGLPPPPTHARQAPPIAQVYRLELGGDGEQLFHDFHGGNVEPFEALPGDKPLELNHLPPALGLNLPEPCIREPTMNIARRPFRDSEGSVEHGKRPERKAMLYPHVGLDKRGASKREAAPRVERDIPDDHLRAREADRDGQRAQVGAALVEGAQELPGDPS